MVENARTITGIVLTEPGVVQLVDAVAPVPAAGEALLRMRFGGVCGSDLASYRGISAYVSYPRTLGHEFSAEVVEVGPNDHGIAPGMLVTALPYFNCGVCYPCRRGRINACTENQTMGVQREGAFSELFTMPIDRIYDGSGIDPRALALIEPFSISYHGVGRIPLGAEDRVLVFGAGAIGILAAVSAKSRGAQVYVTDISAVKVEAAVRDFGLDGGFVNDSSESLRANIERITGGDGFDATVEAVGLPAAFLACVEAASSGGHVVVIGVSKSSADFNATELQRKELTVVGSRAATRSDFDATMALVRDGHVDLGPLITREFSAEAMPQALENLDRNSGEITKLLIRF
ncbi:zinc-binding dehydrogenase [Microbacterium murale]|uniref:Theronine dehydrogenase-like Zn-dependent dehydrogenase n=1 Tax=Microbacterium murale TaxID=1081040 RepID=A0ABQ1RGD0_9MICO|nr:alcohol dehydrogenase catalytic domain-containing protein [Microbacterium murale]GGD69623.1 theronine dehydrogenase-like Zn-dependent dehydrogenase [Microbacterium murale]